MTFDELLTAVHDLTNRPDLVSETKNAVKAATLKAHKLDFFSKDISETGVQFNTPDFRQSLDYIALITNFRALKYLRKAEDATDDTGIFFTVILPEEIVDSYSRNRTDIAYVAGRVLEIRSSTEFQFALMGAYVLPIVTDTGYTSWVAEQQPYAIIYEAVRVVFKTIGLLEESNGYRELVAEEYVELKVSGIADVGS